MGQSGQQEGGLRPPNAPAGLARQHPLLRPAKCFVVNQRRVVPRHPDTETRIGPDVGPVPQNVPDGDHVPGGAAPSPEASFVEPTGDDADANPLQDIPVVYLVNDVSFRQRRRQPAIVTDVVAVGRFAEALAPHRLRSEGLADALRPRRRPPLPFRRPHGCLYHVRAIGAQRTQFASQGIHRQHSFYDRIQVFSNTLGTRNQHQEGVAGLLDVGEKALKLRTLPRGGQVISEGLVGAVGAPRQYCS